MQLDEALRQISDIRQHMTRCTVFRGYRSITVAFSAVAGMVGAVFQTSWVPAPEIELGRYLALWLGLAGLSMIAATVEVIWSNRRTESELTRQQMLVAAQQFLPCVAVGALLTLCLYRGAPQAAWMLPGLWSLIFGLGIFSSAQLLPRQAFWVACYYVLCGLGCLLWGQGERALSPWLMGVSFGGGQLLGAAVLYWTLERTDGPSTE